MIDTHTHLNFAAFEDDWSEVVKKARKVGVEKMIVVGTDIDSSYKAIEMAEEVDCLYAACGIHPHHAKQFLSSNSQNLIKAQLIELERLLVHPKVVAVGEIGLDYHVYKKSKKYKALPISKDLLAIQKELFVSQVKLAVSFNKPVIVHSRESKDEVLDQLSAVSFHLSEKVRGVFHCFEGSKKYAKKILDEGYFISFTGNITYESGRAEASKVVPLDRLMLETDSPYMTPVPLRDKKDNQSRTRTSLVQDKRKMWRNEPSNVKITAMYHAKLREVSFDTVSKQTTLNAKELFGI